MANKRQWKNIVRWFLKEEKETEKNSGEYVELSVWQLGLLIAVTIIVLAGIFYSTSMRNQVPLIFSPREFIAQRIEKNYFENGCGLRNGNFSRGLDYWKTADGGRVFPGSGSRALLNRQDYHSAPCSLEIQTIAPANHYYYVKKKFDGILQNPYNYQSDVLWLGIPSGVSIEVSLWYKGDTLTFYLQGLTAGGEWVTLGTLSGEATQRWTKLEFRKKIPPAVRAIGIELTVNQAQGMPLPRVLIDDVDVRIGREKQ